MKLRCLSNNHTGLIVKKYDDSTVSLSITWENEVSKSVSIVDSVKVDIKDLMRSLNHIYKK
jgi:hypothetical protein